MKHTQGTWDAVLNDDPRGQPVPYYSGLICTVEHGERYLAVVSDGRRVSTDEWEPNARLIAAAPDLLAALKAAMAFIKANVADPDITEEMASAWVTLLDAKPHAAIAKAEGA
jgi:hypothetical protein